MVKSYIQEAVEMRFEPKLSDSKVMFLTTMQHFLTEPGYLQPDSSVFLTPQPQEHNLTLLCPLKLKVPPPVSVDQGLDFFKA